MPKNKDKIVIWPEYFDVSLKESRGRRVPKRIAVQNPNIDDIISAAKNLGLNPKADKDKRYPGRPWANSGMIVVDRKHPKGKTIKMIAEKMAKK